MSNKHLVYVPSILKSVKERMTPADFVGTESVCRYVQNRMQRVASNIEIKVVYDDYNFTDGKEIHINPFWSSDHTNSNFDALLMLLGHALHETLHAVHTDFSVCHQYAIGYIQGKKLLYSDADYYLYRRYIFDIVEDTNIEHWGKREYPGTLRKSLEFANAINYKERRSLRQMASIGMKPLEVLFNALILWGVLGIEEEFPDSSTDLQDMFTQCKPLLDSAHLARKTSDRCIIANDIFEIIRPLIDHHMESGEKCPVFNPIQPSTHNRFDRKMQKFESFRKMRLDQYDIKEDLDWLTDAAAKDEYDSKVDNRYSDQLVKSIAKLQSTGLGPLHNTIELKYIQSNPQLFATYREAYNRRVVRLTPKVKLLLKGILSVVQREQDDTVRNLYAGNQYREPFRADKRCCSYRKALSDEANLFIYVLVDASGSMGTVLEYVKDALTMFNEMCKKINVPITIVSHTAKGNEVAMRTLVDANTRRSDYNGIEGLNVEGGTRDGVALCCAAEYLKFRKENQKILIAISDGEPWHTCDLNITPELMELAKTIGLKPSNAPEFFREYSNYSAADIKTVIRSRGIKPIGIALAPTMDLARLLQLKIRGLYPESFATDIDHLAKKLAKILENYLYD